MFVCVYKYVCLCLRGSRSLTLALPSVRFGLAGFSCAQQWKIHFDRRELPSPGTPSPRGDFFVRGSHELEKIHTYNKNLNDAQHRG